MQTVIQTYKSISQLGAVGKNSKNINNSLNY